MIIAAAIAAFATASDAQDQRPPGLPPTDARFGPPPGRDAEPRPNLLAELGLTRDQVQAMRRLNQERKPVEQAARKRFQEANRALNQAIYSDVVDDASYRSALAEFQAAQAEIAKIKFSNELAVRRLLTPAQLAKFRELRRRFAEARENPGSPADGPPPRQRMLENLRQRRNPPRMN